MNENNQGVVNKVFIFGKVPELNTYEHKKWAYINNLEDFNLKHPTESGEVADEMLQAGVKKFLEV